jgi:hypothetical protein
VPRMRTRLLLLNPSTHMRAREGVLSCAVVAALGPRAHEQRPGVPEAAPRVYREATSWLGSAEWPCSMSWGTPRAATSKHERRRGRTRGCETCLGPAQLCKTPGLKRSQALNPSLGVMGDPEHQTGRDRVTTRERERRRPG